MASLFGKNRLQEIAQKIGTEEIEHYLEIAKTWREDYYTGSLKVDKETSREQQYNRDFFLTILGYREKPVSPYSFEPKATTTKGQLPDAVVSYTDKANDIENIAAVVELKGASVELDRPQRREGNMSPVQQAFKYKTQYRNCPFVIVSNFWEFRLYHDNQLDYEVWTLDDLVNPDDDYILFKTWYVLLKRENFTTPKGASTTEGVLSDIRVEQEDIGKKFYKIYKDVRLELLRDIYAQNAQVREDIDLGIEKAQKIIDRIIFTAFAEDRGLLPDDTLLRIVRVADNSSLGISLWDTLKSVFNAIDQGNEKLEIPEGYNGGLFRFDPDLNGLRISDEPLRKVVDLGRYNFAEDLSVNILGHIFEQSISDLEEIKSKVNESNNLEELGQSRRKKDGIFYTPDYIVRYIVDNSLGAYLREREEEFKKEFGLKGSINEKNYEKRERQAYAKYQDFLQNVKVVDPACGSGAFLVYVFDYLLAENKRVGDILGNTLFSADDYIRDILRHNIYGVDLNEESVEITKLSLWLKSAQKGKKLTTLDANIKCGNSLIDDPSVAGDKAFDWQEQFPEIFENGGFDIIVGNPPYLRIQGLKNNSIEQTKFFEASYKAATGKYDIYVLFMERGFKLLSSRGILSYILPHKFLISDFGRGIRRFIIENQALSDIVSFGSDRVFQDAMTYTCIIKMDHGNVSVRYRQSSREDLFEHAGLTTVSYKDLGDGTWSLGDKETSVILGKIQRQPDSAGDVFAGIFQGLVSMGDDIYMLRGNIDGELFTGYSSALKQDVCLEAELLKPVLKGQDIKRYSALSTKLYVVYPHYIDADNKTRPIDEDVLKSRYPRAYAYLLNFKPLLEAKKVKYKTDQKYWYALHRSRDISIFRSEKLITPQLQNYPNFTYDNSETFTDAGGYLLVPKSENSSKIHSYLAVLNSSLMWFYIKTTSSEFSGGFYYFKTKYIAPFRFPPLAVFDRDNMLDSYAKKAIDVRSKLSAFDDKFRVLLRADNVVMPDKLDKWWKLDFADFVKALKIRLSLVQKDELLQLFEKYRTECTMFDAEIQKTDHEIDQIVYKLYQLTPKEIAIIEGRSRE